MENNTIEHFDQTKKSSDMKLMSCQRIHNERRKRRTSARTEKSRPNVFSATQRRSRWSGPPAKQKLRTVCGRKRADSKAKGLPAAQREKRRPGCRRMWEETGQNHRPAATLPVSEDEFLRDMLSSRPRFRSRSQRRPMRYWVSVAAVLPAYQGPRRPGLLNADHSRDMRSPEAAAIHLGA